jgi:hypothetical protein
MHDLEGQPLQEVAEALQLTLAAVTMQSLWARLYLREWLTIHFKNDIETTRVNESQICARRAVAAFA